MSNTNFTDDCRDEVELLILWLKCLNEGYVKPDVNSGKPGVNSMNSTGIVKDTKDFIPYISGINETLSNIFGIETDLTSVQERKNRQY